MLHSPKSGLRHQLALARMVSDLRCPESGETLRIAGDRLVSDSGRHGYPLSPTYVPLFAEVPASADARVQQRHYEIIAARYIEHLGYPHTEEYTAYLDAALRRAAGPAGLGVCVEICCGHGEGTHLLGAQIKRAIGVDVSLSMLEAAQERFTGEAVAFVQGDATRLPLADESMDTAIMLGGIHHVNDRAGLFGEIRRVLKPGGRFIFREPVDDFAPWRWLRALIYRLSPALDHRTERPLRRSSTQADLERAGLTLADWRTYGFLGFCLFMNSDVLVFNRLFRYLPFIRKLTRAAIRLDQAMLTLPFLADAGLQVVGVAEKPKRA
jgi:SAM-dependent methyltransferase